MVTIEPKLIKNSDFDWLKNNYAALKETYANKWVAIVDERVVSSGDTFIDVLSRAKEQANKTPYMIRIAPEKREIY